MISEKDLALLDYILQKLSKSSTPLGLRRLAHEFKETIGIEFNPIEMRRFQKKYDGHKYEYFTSTENGFLTITSTADDIIVEYGTLSKYLSVIYEKEQIVQKEQNELLNLQKKNLKLQNDNLKYKETIRDQEERIRTLTEHNTIIDILRGYWWLVTIGIIIGGILYRLIFD